MGRLTRELEVKAEGFYSETGGLLISISESRDADSNSSRLSLYCDNCKKCLGGFPVISLGEIDRDLIGSGLFAVGLLDVDPKVKQSCPIFINFSGKR